MHLLGLDVVFQVFYFNIYGGDELMKGAHMGESEELVLLIAAVLFDTAYGWIYLVPRISF